MDTDTAIFYQAVILCGECSEAFNLKGRTFTRRYGDVEELGYRCPKCGHESVAMKTNNEVRELQREVLQTKTQLYKAMAAGTDVEVWEGRLGKQRQKLAAAYRRMEEQTPRITPDHDRWRQAQLQAEIDEVDAEIRALETKREQLSYHLRVVRDRLEKTTEGE